MISEPLCKLTGREFTPVNMALSIKMSIRNSFLFTKRIFLNTKKINQKNTASFPSSSIKKMPESSSGIESAKRRLLLLNGLKAITPYGFNGEPCPYQLFAQPLDRIVRHAGAGIVFKSPHSGKQFIAGNGA